MHYKVSLSLLRSLLVIAAAALLATEVQAADPCSGHKFLRTPRPELSCSRLRLNIYPSPDGMLRGWRHTMLDDTDISATRHARAAVGGVIAGITGCPAVFVSGGAEHQGPAGGGPIAIIGRLLEMAT